MLTYRFQRPALNPGLQVIHTAQAVRERANIKKTGAKNRNSKYRQKGIGVNDAMRSGHVLALSGDRRSVPMRATSGPAVAVAM
jgi:hypothetical protein